LGLAAWGALAGRAAPNLPLPDWASHLVNSARTGSSTAWPDCLASRIDQTTRAAWWHEAQLCLAFQASASLTRKPSPRLMVAPTSAGAGRTSPADAAAGRTNTRRATIQRM